MKLSVLMFCTQFRPLVGGTERQAEKLSRALVQSGLKVTVLTPRIDRDSPYREEVDGVDILRFSLTDWCKRYPMIRGLGPINLVGLYAQMRKILSRQIGEHDIVHAHGISVLTPFALHLARMRRKAFVCKLASTGRRFDLDLLAKIGIGGKTLSKYLRNNVTAWVATTTFAAGSLEDHNIEPKYIYQIPNGVEIPSPGLRMKNRRPVRNFLYVGRLSQASDRDIDTLVDAFLLLTSEFVDVRLALVGDGDSCEGIRSKINRLGLAERVNLPGMVTEPKEWFTWADCFVLPSRTEGMSNSLIEAMAFGLICIANDIPGNREVLDDGRVGILTKVGDLSNLYDQMKRIILQPQGDRHLGDLALARAQNEYALEHVASMYVALYNQLMMPAQVTDWRTGERSSGSFPPVSEPDADDDQSARQ